MVPDLVVVLRTISDLISAFELYNAYLAAHILPYPVRYIGDPAKLDCQYERLSSLEAFIVLALVWKESGHLTEADLSCAGLRRLFEQRITRRALGNALKASARRPASYDSADMYARRASRIVEAAITFGLIEPQADDDESCRTNFKPLRATRKLHDLMIDVGSAAAVLIHKPLAGE
jgi:hypothetical protein